MTQPFETLLVRDDGPVRVVTFNRPERRNAMNITLGGEWRRALHEAAHDPSVRAVVVTGAGDHYSSGADMQVFSDMAQGKLSGDPRVLGRIDEPLRAFPKPLIAAVDGQCVGMAVTTLPFFDLVYASERATFHTPFVRLGLLLEMGSSYTLPRLMGRQRANELLLRAEPLDAHTAERWGLVTRVFSVDALHTEALRAAHDVAKGGPESVAATKRLLWAGEEGELAHSVDGELEALVRAYASEEHKQAVRAFFTRKNR